MPQSNLNHLQDRIDLAAAFRWAARLNMHEGVANHWRGQSFFLCRKQ